MLERQQLRAKNEDYQTRKEEKDRCCHDGSPVINKFIPYWLQWHSIEKLNFCSR